MSHLNHLDHLKIPLRVIKKCTCDFNKTNFIGKGGYGKVYKGILTWAPYKSQLVAVKRLDVIWGQGSKEFYTEIVMLSQYRHENIITLVGFCDENKEMILVYEYATYGSLDTYLCNPDMLGKLSWPIRLNICIGVASALDYLHNHVAEKHRVIHRDIKSANILLDKNWNAKLSDFGFSRIGLANQQNTFLITNVAGTHGYCDPQYEKTGILTKESDVYSLGVVLFEILCGRLGCVTEYHDHRRFLHHLARTCYERKTLETIIDITIKKDIQPSILSKFSAIAYQCLQETRENRPAIAKVVWELKGVEGDSTRSLMDAALLIQKRFRLFMIRKYPTRIIHDQVARLDAALLIQRRYRSFIIRHYPNRRTYDWVDPTLSPMDAALIIQTRFRSFISRKNATHMAALLIQRSFRSYMTRKSFIYSIL